MNATQQEEWMEIKTEKSEFEKLVPSDVYHLNAFSHNEFINITTHGPCMY